MIAQKGWRLWLAIGTTLLLLATAWMFWRANAAPQAHFVEVGENAYILPKPDPIAAFRLTRHDNSPFDNAALKGKWTFFFFGFTHCPDVCPATLHVFDQVHRLLKERPQGIRDMQFVFVSVIRSATHYRS